MRTLLILLPITTPAWLQTFKVGFRSLTVTRSRFNANEYVSTALMRSEDSKGISRTGNPWRYGQKSANALDEFLRGKVIRCVPVTKDRYGRTVTQCHAGLDTQAWMMRNGWATAYRKFGRN